MKVGGDIDDFHAGNAFMSASTGTIYASNINKIKAGGDLTISGGITLDDSDIGTSITAGKNVKIDSKIVAENVGLISASDGNVSISSGGSLDLAGDLAGITASGNILIEADASKISLTATIMAEGSVGDLTAGGKIEIA